MSKRSSLLSAAGALLLFSAPSVHCATIRMAGCSWVTYSQVTASNVLVDSTATLSGTGTIHAATTVQGDLTPGYGTNTGVLAFSDNVYFDNGSLNCYASTDTVSRISAAGNVSGTGTVVMTRAPGAVPVGQTVISGAAASDYASFSVSPAAGWYLSESGTLDLLISAVPELVMLGTNGTAIANGAAAAVSNGSGFAHILNGTNETHIFTITNSGLAALNISGWSTNGTDAASFAVSGLTNSLASGAADEFTVQYNPSSAGTHSASLSISSDDPASPFVLNLSGSCYEVSTNVGPSAGGNTITITNGVLGGGSDITNVTVGGVSATITGQGTDWVTIVLPSGPTGTVEVVVQSTSQGDTTLNGAYTYNPAGAIGEASYDWTRWEAMPGLPQARYYSGGDVLDGKMYVVGGSDAANTPVTNVYMFDGTSWTEVAGLPQALRETAVVTYDGALYSIGGYTGSTRVTNVYKFNGTTWSEVAGLPAPRVSMGAGVLGGNLIAYGGRDTGGALTNVFSFDGSSWTEITGMNPGKFSMGYASLNGKLYSVGGYTFTSATYEFDGTSWSAVSNYPVSCVILAGATLDGYMYMYGGQDFSADVTNAFRYDGSAWSEIVGLPIAMSSLGAAAYDGSVYAFGGRNGSTTLTNVYRYPAQTVDAGVSPSSGSWTGGYQVVISGSNLGNGFDITNVTLSGYSVSSIVSQDDTQVVVLADSGLPSVPTVATNLQPAVSCFNLTTFDGVAYTNIASKQLAFLTGTNTHYYINEIQIKLRDSSSSPGDSISYKIDLRNTTDTTTNAAAGTSVYATDTISFNLPVAGVAFTQTLTAAEIPNIASVDLSGQTGYSLTLYGASTNTLALYRATGVNNSYTTEDGFVALNTLSGNSSVATTYSIKIICEEGGSAGDVEVCSTSYGTTTKRGAFTYLAAEQGVLGTNGATIASGADFQTANGSRFHPVLLGGALTNVFSITNSGTEELLLSYTTNGADQSCFDITDVPAVIPVGGVSNFTVIYQPIAIGSHTATVEFANNTPDAPFLLNLAGSCYDVSTNVGPYAGGNSVTFTNGNFGTITNVLVGGVSATITGSGTSWVTITMPSIGTNGTVDVIVQTSDNGDTRLAGAYSYNPAGVIAGPSETQAYVIGTGSLTNAASSAGYSPIMFYYYSSHYQFLYQASDFAAAGLSGPARIVALGFDVVSSTAGKALPSFLVRMKHSDMNDMSLGMDGTDLTVCYSNVGYIATAGDFDMLAFETPFEWNGSSNVIVDTAFAKATTWANAGQTTYDAIDSRGSTYRTDAVDSSYDFDNGSTISVLPRIRVLTETVHPAINPSSGSYTGGYQVVINGTNLCNGSLSDVTNVTLAGKSVTSIDSVSGSTQIVVTAASLTGSSGDVVVHSISYGTTTKADAFTYLEPQMLVLGTNGAPVVNGGSASSTNGLDYGELIVGRSWTNTFSITNSGNTALNISGVSTSGTAAASFTVMDYPTNITEGTAETFTVVFTPQSGGLNSAALNFANDSTTTPYVVNLAGTGIGGGIALETNKLTYTATYLGSDPAAQTLIMTNVGVSGFSYSNNWTYSTGASGWLSISLSSGNVSLSGSVGLTNSVAVTNLNAGTYYATNVISSADATNAPQSYVVQFTVDKADQTISFPAIGNQLTTNSVGLSATATSGLGVSFAVASGPASISSGTNLSFTGAGSVSITALQAGNTNWNAAATVTNTFSVSKTDQTVSFPNIGNQLTTNVVTLSATATSGLSVTNFGVVSGPAQISGTTLTFTNSGSVTVSAQQDGSAIWNASPITNITFDVTKAVASVTLVSTNQTYDGSNKVVTATTVPSGQTVDITYNGSSTAPTNAGTYTVVGTVNEAMYQGGATGTLTVAKANQTISFTNPGTQAVTNILGLSATASSSLPVSFSVASGPAALNSGTNATFSSAGTVSLLADQAGNSNWNAAPTITNTFSVVGVITNVSPASGTMFGGTQVTISGLWLGNGSDITNVTLCDVTTKIVTQTVHAVTVATGPSPVETNGNVVVQSGYGTVVLTNGFTYRPVPPAPEALSAVDITDSQFTARWKTAETATNYVIDVSETNTFSSYTGIYSNWSMGDATAGIVTGLTDGVTYWYRLRAENAYGASTNSNIIEVPVSTNTPYVSYEETNGVASAGSSDVMDLTELFHGSGMAYTVISNSNPALVTALTNGTQIIFTYTAGMTGTAHITIRATNLSTGFWVENTITVSVAPEPGMSLSTIVLNRQNGLYEQTVTVSNASPTLAAKAVTLTVTNLTTGASLYNATGADEHGNSQIQWAGTLPAQSTMDFTLQYYTANRTVAPTGTVMVSLSLEEPQNTISGTAFELSGTPQTIGGTQSFLIEFTATPGHTYYIQYTDSLTNPWKTVQPPIVAPVNRIQWIDSGPPGTESTPGSVSNRFYRIIGLEE